MADLVNKDAIVRFLSGYEENLNGVAVENGTVYFALKPDPLNSSNTIGSIYLDANGKRILMSGESLAILDGMGDKILTKYIKAIELDGSAGTKGILTYIKGDGTPVDVTMPAAGSSTAGIVTTGSQTFAGAKTFNGVLIPKSGSYIHSGVGTSGTVGYVKLAQFKITGTYQNMPIVIELVDRTRVGSCVLNIQFTNTNSSDPGLASFTYQGTNYTCYLYKSATSTWDLYVKKGEGYGQPTVVRYHKSPYMSKVAVTWTDVHADSVPSGATLASLGGSVLHASKADSATKATQDGSGNNINTTYLKDLDSEGTTSVFKIWGIKGNSNNGTIIEIPAATDAKAGLVSTGAQTFAGVKTFKGFVYSGIQADTASTTGRGIWFMSATTGTPVYSSKFTYTPSTDTVTAANFNGLAAKATADGNGTNIRNTYLKNIEVLSTDNHKLTLIKGNDSTSNITFGFVLQTGDTMSGKLTLNGGLLVNTKTGDAPLVISRTGGTTEATTIYQNDNTLFVNMVNDETTAAIQFNLSATDTETGGGAGANSGKVSFGLSKGKTTVTADNFTGLASKATADSAGNNILDKYISAIDITTHTGTAFAFTAYDGNGNNQNTINLPVNTAGTLATLVTTGAQTFVGKKTFSGGVQFTTNDWNYSAIETATSSVARPVWFAHSDRHGTPVINTNFTYNPSTKTLTVEKITGTITKATGDGQGNEIYTTYLADVASSNDATTFKIWGVRKNGANSPSTITIGGATASKAGLVTTGAQTWAGSKTFSSDVIISGTNTNIKKNGSSTSWIYGRDTALVVLDTYNAYAAISSMKTTDGDWSNGVYTGNIMYWTYTPDTQYTAKNNTGYVQMKLQPDGKLITVSSQTGNLFATSYITIGTSNSNYGLYNAKTSYFADKVTTGAAVEVGTTLLVKGATTLQSTLTVGGATTVNNTLTVTGKTSLAGMALFTHNESVTSGTAAGYRNSLLIYGQTYGNDATYLKTAGTLSYGDPGPQIIFGTSTTLTSSQKAALIFTDHDTIATGCSLSLVSTESNVSFIAPTLRAKTALTVNGTATIGSTLKVTGVTTLNSMLKANAGIEVKGDIVPVEGDLTQNLGGGIGGKGWILWGKLGSWHPEKIKRPTSANVAPRGDYSLSYFLASTSMTTGKPTSDSHIINLEWDTTAGWTGQIAVPTSDTNMQWRTQNGSADWSTAGAWRSIIDSKNFTSFLNGTYVNITGDTMTGNLTAPNFIAKTKITTPILFASNYVSIGTENANYGLYNAKKTYLADTVNMGSTLTVAGATTLNSTLTVAGNTTVSGTITAKKQIYTSFKSAVATGSYQATATTIPDLITEVRYSSGVVGSVNITTAYTSPTTQEVIPTGWYNFEYIPHRSGGANGAASGDNCNYGTLLLYGMTMGSQHWRIRFASSAIAEVRRVWNDGDVLRDENKQVIRSTYLKDIELTAETDTSRVYTKRIVLTKVKGNSSTTTIESLANRLESHDIRAITLTPQQTPKGLTLRFAQKSSHAAITDTGNYLGIASWRSYGGNVDGGSDLTGGNPLEIAYTQAGNLWTRIGTSATAWGSWVKILSSANYAATLDPIYVNVSGDTMTGDLVVNGSTGLTVANLTQTKNLYATNNVSIGSSNTGYGLYNAKTTYLCDILTVDTTGNGNIALKHPSNPFISFTLNGTLVGYVQAYNGSSMAIGPTFAKSMVINSAGQITVPNYFTINGTLKTSHNLYNYGTTYLAGAVTANSTLAVTGATTLSSTLTVNGAATLNNTLLVKGTATFNSPVTIANDLTVNGDILGTGNITRTGALTITGKGTVDTLTITNASAVAHIAFSRASCNYITAPTSGYFAFIPNGQSITTTTADLIIANGSVYPGSNNVTTLGSSSYRWSSIYAGTAMYLNRTSSGGGYYLQNSGVQYGRFYVSAVGTAATTEGTYGTLGDAILTIGNATARSTVVGSGANNARGRVRLYNPGAGYVDIIPGSETSSSYTLYLPGATGQLVYHTNNTAIGGARRPVYVAASGAVTAITYAATTSKMYVGGVTSTTAGCYYNSSVYTSGTVLYGAAWNDYAEYRQTSGKVEPGRVVIETGKGDLKLSTERLQPGANVVSDTFGFAIGETKKAKTPLAVAGRVLVYPYEDKYSYEPGDAVCTGPNGTVSKMTREEIWKYPERIVGTVSEIPEYDVWDSGDGPLKVNGRIWIKVK